MNSIQGKVEEKFRALEKERTNWILLGEKMSALTMPYIFPKGGEENSLNVPVLYSNIGAFAVKNLASKLMLQVLPPNQAFFRMNINPKANKILSAENPDAEALAKIKSEIESNLSELESRIQKEIGKGSLRSVAYESLLHYLIVGNVVLHIPAEGAPSITDLHSFVAERDYSGDLLLLIIRDCAAKETLTENQLRAYVPDKMGDNNEDEEEIEVFTVMQLINRKEYRVWQEVSGNVVVGTEKTYKKDRAPFIVLRASSTPGEDYGHPYVESFEGDLTLSESLTKAVKQCALASSRLVFGIDPSAPVGLEEVLTKAPNGSFHRFKAEHVQPIQTNKTADLSVTANVLSDVHNRIRTGFLMAYSRDAERVTAEENRIHYQELQAVLGGTFSMLAADFQAPLVYRVLERLKASGELDDISDAIDYTVPTIITGIDAIGRNSDLNNLVAFTEIVQKAFGPSGTVTYINGPEFLSRVGSATNVRTKGLIKTQEQVQAQQNMSAMQAMGEKAVGPMVNAMASQQGQPQ